MTDLDEEPAGSVPQDGLTARSSIDGSENTQAWRRAEQWFTVERLFVLLSLALGTLVAVFVPASQVLDEAAHWNRVWAITDGHLVAETVFVPSVGETVNTGSYDVCALSFVESRFAEAQQPAFSFGEIWDSPAACDQSGTETRVGEAMGSYSIWSYPAQSVAVGLGRLMQLPVPAIFLFGRLASLLLYTGLVYLAIARTSRLKTLLAFTALLPISLNGAASYSTDGVVIASCLFLISAAVRFSNPSEQMRRADIALIAGSALAVCLTKPPYALFLLLFLCYAPTAFGTRERTRNILAGISGAAVALTLFWTRFGYPAGAVKPFFPEANPPQQVRWILSHPLSFLNVVSDSFLSVENQEGAFRSWMGWAGMFRGGTADPPYFLNVVGMFAAGALVLFTMKEFGPRLTSSAANERKLVWLPLILAPCFVFVLYLSSYVAWSAVGAPSVYGVQGRYFVPALPLVGASFAMGRDESNVPVGSRAVAVAAGVLGICSAIKIQTFFY